MATQDTDISWQVLRQIVHDWAGSHVELTEVKRMDGGNIATTMALHTSAGDRAVLKITPHRVDLAYRDEAHQLDVLRKVGLPTPQVYKCDVGSLDRPFSYLLLEYRDGVDLAHAKQTCTTEQFDALQAELAALVRQMHAETHTHYCRVTASAEPKPFDSWGELYREAFDLIRQEAEKTGLLPTKSRKLVSRVHERLPALLGNDDCPRLLHGDLWSSNILAAQGSDGAWHVTAILDPLCKFGHVECELAYLELFHTVNGAFMRAYQGERHLPNEYHRVRKPVYHLYELLNHLQLFGQEYLKPTLGAIERVGHLV